MSIIKEPNYYCQDLWDVSSHISYVANSVENNLIELRHNAIIKDHKAYLYLFSKCNNDCLYYGDASPSYLRSKEAAKRIFKDSPKSKIIVILRDPIERAWSHYIMEKNESRVPSSFDDLVNYELELISNKQISQHGILESGLYYENIARYIKYFHKDDILVADFSRIFSNIDFLDNELSLFLQIDKHKFCKKPALSNSSVSPRFDLINKIANKYNIKTFIRRFVNKSIVDKVKHIYYVEPPRSTEIREDTLLKLRKFYSKDMKKLYKLLGKSTPDWVDRY
jgi:hypothetical protein